MCKQIIDRPYTVTYYISWGVGLRKVSSRKSDLQRHAVSLVMDTYDFLLVFHCNCVCILHRFRDIIIYFPKCRSHVTINTSPLGVNLLSMQ